MVHLRTRILLLLAAVAATFLATAWWVQHRVVLPSFVELERQLAVADLDRGIEALRNEVGFVADYVSDWAGWDDTYAFVADRNAEFVQSNLASDVFRDNSFDFLSMVAPDGSEVWRGAMVADQPVAVDELPSGTWPLAHPLLTPKGLDELCSGVVVTNHGPLLVACRPITDSAREKEPRGWIIMGRFVTESRLDKLRRQTRLDLGITPVAAMSAEQRALDVAPLATAAIRFVETPERLVGRTLVPGLRGDGDTLLLEVRAPRSVLAQGRHMLSFVSYSTVVSVLSVFAVLAVVLQRLVVGPLQKLTAHALAIRASGDTTKRSGIERADEVGTLAREFDGMVERLAELRAAHVQAARVGGMAEVARCVLHDVGNALQPVQGNLGALQERVVQRHAQDLERVLDLMQAHAHDLGPWLTDDPRGRKVPGFLRALATEMQSSAAAAQQEVELLGRGLSHIRQLVDRQRAHADARGVAERVVLRSLLDEAVRMSGDGPLGVVAPQVQCPSDVVVVVEQHRLLAVCINLLRNARFAVQGRPDPVVRVVVDGAPGGVLHLAVVDNGVGIAKADQARVFQSGFSTRAGGQGLGLHGCANSLAEVGGRLWLESAGAGCGATFHVELPASVWPIQVPA
ncbi:MAG: HAMP domain-containing protein [Planctomycetes bacterium]|nr:HAMP domain-containing protein [Planctomycetota bacterium]